MTNVVKIELASVEDLDATIKDTCDVREAAGLKLAGMVTLGGYLIMVFQGELK